MEHTEGNPPDGKTGTKMVTRLDSPLRLPCGAVLKNRLAKAAMTEGIACENNRATPEHARLYGRWAQGGAGLLLTGNVLVDRRFLERPGNVVIDENGGYEELSAYAKAGSQNGAHIWMQINHPGRQAATGIQPFVSASENAQPGNEERARALEAPEIEDLVRRYIHSAKVAQDTGFTGVEIHAAHGYLLSQFLSPLTNRREDQWGGSLENRARALLEIIRGVREAVGKQFPISVKLNSADFQNGGFAEEESIQVIQWLESEGIDLLEISGGNYESMRMSGRDESLHLISRNQADSTVIREAYFLEFAESIRPRVKVPIALTGGFRTRISMEHALESGEVDVIGLGRPLCYDPDYCNQLLSGEVDRIFSPAETFAFNAEDAKAMNETELRWAEVGVAGAYHFNQIRRLASGQETEKEIQWKEQLDLNESREAEAEARYRAAFLGEKSEV